MRLTQVPAAVPNTPALELDLGYRGASNLYKENDQVL